MQESAQAAGDAASPSAGRGPRGMALAWPGWRHPPAADVATPFLWKGVNSSNPQHEGHRPIIHQSNLHMGTEAAGCNPRVRDEGEFHQPVEPAPALVGRGGC